MRKLSLALISVAGCMFPLSAMAQDTSSSSSDSGKAAVVGGKLSDEQLMLNNQAVAAVKNNEFKKAELLYQALLELGEFNYIWYQLGKTYARQDKCVEAYDAYGHVETAPILDPEEYNPEMIKDATRKGLAELDDKCSAKVEFTCNPEQMTLSVDGGVEFECSSNQVPFTPGRHSVYAKTSFGFNTVVVTAVSGQVTTSKVKVINYEEIASNAGLTPEELEQRSRLFKILGYTFVGAGAAIGIGGGLWMWWEDHDYDNYYKEHKTQIADVQKKKDKAEKMLPVSYALLATGSAMAVAGAVLLIYDAVKIQPQLEDLYRNQSFNISPVFSPEFSGFALTGTF